MCSKIGRIIYCCYKKTFFQQIPSNVQGIVFCERTSDQCGSLSVCSTAAVTLTSSNANKSKSTVRGIRLPLILKLPKEGTLRTIEQLDAVLKETFLLLNREIDLYRYSPGFPEFTFVILQRLRKVR